MIIRKVLIGLILLNAFIAVKAAELQVATITDDILVISEGLVKITAVRTDSGIIVIDSFLELQSAREARKVILKQYPDIPIRYLINTHHHADHVRGNQYFRDAAILAHKHVGNYMIADYERLQKKYENYSGKITELELNFKRVENKSNKLTKKIAEELKIWREAKDFFEEYKLTPPTIQISSDTVLKLGGKTFEIHHYGVAHTDNDLVILDREDRLLIMGDLLCLRKCYIMNRESNVKNWIDLLDKLILREAEYDYVIPGHGAVAAKVGALREQRDYLQDIHDKVADARKKGLTLNQAKDHIDTKQYQHYIHYDKIGLDIEACWNQLQQ